MKKSLFILVLLITTGGIIYLYRKDIRKHFIPTIEQIGDVHVKVQNDTCYVSSQLTATNKTYFKIGIDTIKYRVSLANKVYLQNKKFIGMTLHAHAKDTVDFSLKIPYKTIIEDLKEQRKKGDSTSYAINVSLQFTTFLGKAEMPINKTAKLKIPQPPEIEVMDIKYSKVRMKSILANVKVKIINYSSVNLSIKKMSYSMDVIKQGNVKGRHQEQIDIKPHGTTIIELPMEISPKHIARTLFDVIVDKDSYDYTLTLNAILEATDPLKDSFPIDLIKKGKMELKK